MPFAVAFRTELHKLASPQASFSRFGKRLGGAALLAVPVGAAAYGLGRGLKRGERDKEQAARSDAIRASRLSGTPSPY